MMKDKKMNLFPGDLGRTAIYSGEEFSKNSPRIAALGDLDELNAVLGVARAHIPQGELHKRVYEIQQALFLVGSELATTDPSLHILKKRVDEGFLTEWIERIDDFEKNTPPPKGFIVPGESTVSAYLNLARTVSRRCERSIIHLFDTNEISNQNLLIWFNRISIYIHLLARHEANPPSKE